MGLIKETSKILDKTARVLNEAAFGDIRNIFKDNSMYNFAMRPIGLLQKSYDFTLDHLYRNIGNSEYTYDGYTTPIGEVAEPFYNTIVHPAWFYLDYYKNSTANYLDYIRNVYGATLSVENINHDFLFHLSDDASKVGYVDGMHAIDALVNDTNVSLDVSYTGYDTRLGIDGGYYNRETLRNAVVTNDYRTSFRFSITDSLSEYLGLNTKNTTDKKTYNKVLSKETGRFKDNVFNKIIDSPVDNSNYGHYSDLGSYTDFYNSLSEKSKEFYNNNFKGKFYLSFFSPDLKEGESRWKTSSNTIRSNSGIIVDLEKNVDGQDVRYIFKTISSRSNILDSKNGSVYVYTENEFGSSPNITYASYNSGTKFSRYTSYGEGLTVNDLLKKTNDSFKKGKYKTIIARFHTDPQETTDTTQTAISGEYGMSHGRNLLKRTKDDSEGYKNPYCRVWTFHHQYKSLKDTIRPADLLNNDELFTAFTADNSNRGGFVNGRARLRENGALHSGNGLVNITPIDSADKKVDIKNCMFSIENLAWKDAFSTDQKSRESFQVGGLSPEQKGPFGGRIMWFPPYGLDFNEDVNVNWSETNFIGRGEGIYTYANTTRTGTLSFMLLVDHPSIINYWENRGKSVSNSVDDIDDPEQELLRFFAGCDILTSTPAPIKEEEPATSDDTISSPTTQIIKFFVFFPNNYSGVDDDPEDAMRYIANGLGAGKEKVLKLVDGECYESSETTDYKIPFAKSIAYINGKTYEYGGYEMIAGRPISLNAYQNEDGYIGAVKVGEGNGNCIGGKTALYTQNGDAGREWWECKWYYRIDNAYKNQLLKKENYIDTDSFCLNSKAGQEKIIEQFSITDAENLYSFADIFVAIEGAEAKSVLNESSYNSTKVEKLLKLIKQFGIDHVECIGRASSQGHESSNNELQKNRAKTIKNWLSNKTGFDSSKIEVTTGGTGGNGSGINSGNENDIINKLWRCAEVNIHLKKEESKTTQASASERFTDLDGDGNAEHQTNFNTGDIDGIERVKYFTDLSANKMIEEEILKDRNRSIKLNHLSDNINNLAFNLKSSVRNGNVNVNSIFGAVADFSEHNKKFQYNNLGFIVDNFRGKSNYDINNKTTLHDNAQQSNGNGINTTLEDKTDDYQSRQGTSNNAVKRYDNEAKFFSMLEKEEPFLHHKISDKIKYFDPAFHSISPEGFNARLTFLHQCTRQGPTVGSSDSYTASNTANNLSFGRPPVCILRLGDFYYTKIIIDGISITFDPLVWDLNTEGIGVMPMIAKITMRFKFIGGSSLAGHITRLQNAVSFNYYANTEVYDNRSELALYDENGNISKFAANPILYD